MKHNSRNQTDSTRTGMDEVERDFTLGRRTKQRAMRGMETSKRKKKSAIAAAHSRSNSQKSKNNKVVLISRWMR